MKRDNLVKLNMVHDPLDDLLKTDADAQRAAYLDDGGFTLRVMDVLPARPAVSSKIRYGLPLAMATGGALFAGLFTAAGSFVVDATMDIVTQTVTPSAVTMAVLLTVMIGVGIASSSSER